MAGVFDGVVVLRLQAFAIDGVHRCLASGVVALQADAIARCLELRAVGVVAVAAAHTLVGHFALGEGAVLEHFVLDLAVQGVQLAGQGAWQVIVHQALADGEAITQRRAARVAAGAGFDFDGGVLVLEVDGKTRVDQVGLFRRPFQVIGGRAVTGLATDAEAVPLAVEGVFRGIEIALVAGGVALDAHEVGVLAGLAPVQRVLEGHALARVEMKPAVLLGIPGDAQGLQATVAHLDQVLLQRCDAEGVGDLEVGVLAVDAGGVDPESVVLSREPGGFVLGLEGDAVEVAEHRLGIGWLHRQLMMGTLPVLDLGAVAALALLFVDHVRRRHGNGLWLGGLDDRGADWRRGHGGRLAAEQEPADARDRQQQDADGDGEQVTIDQGRLRIRVWLCSFIFMCRHYDFRSPGAFAVRRALMLEAALPQGRRVSIGDCDEADGPIAGKPAPAGASLLAKAICHSPTNQRKYGFPPSPRITSRTSLAQASRSPS
ncbi:hypothetical protein D3C76_846750 [compost metagenome]